MRYSKALKILHRYKEIFPNAVIWFEYPTYYQAFLSDAKKTADVLNTNITEEEGIVSTSFLKSNFDRYMDIMEKNGYSVGIIRTLTKQEKDELPSDN
jgi:DNA mismatch repair ATPase MutS